MQLVVLSDYRAGAVAYKKGQTIHVSDLVGEFLLRDSPGSFELVESETASGIQTEDRRARGGRRR